MTKEASASSRIVRNSLWYGLEALIETFVFLLASVAVARYLGPQKLGYYSFINFFVTVVTRTSGAGLAGATRKYMSEFLAQGKPGIARAVYYLAYKYQLLGSVLITVIGITTVLLFADPAFKAVSCILILSITPGIMSWVPAEANNAFEDASKNTLSALGYLLSYAIIIALTIHFRWDLIGVASASLVGRTVEVLLRTFPLHRRLRALPLEALDEQIVQRIRRFCLQAIGIQLLMSVVWDRSELIFLKTFSGLEQLAFYSVSFSLANNLLAIPRTLGSATGMTLMVESSRDPGRVNSIMRNTCRYLFFLVLPIHLGAIVLADRAIRLAYGVRYVDAIPVMIVAAFFAIPRAVEELPNVLLKAADRQKTIFFWLIVTGMLNILLDVSLIPHFGAVGAALANGLAQCFGVVSMFRAARQSYQFGFPVKTVARLAVAAALVAIISLFAVRWIPGLLGLITAIVLGLASYLPLVRLLHALEPSDRDRFLNLAVRLPEFGRKRFLAVIMFLTPAVAEIEEM